MGTLRTWCTWILLRHLTRLIIGSFRLYDKVIRWIRSYLTARTYRVQVVDALSQETRIKCGVPQRSEIGPLLFLLFVNDLPIIIIVTTLRFVNDVKMVSPRSQSDRLQRFFHNVWNWLVNWDLPINPTKCNCIAVAQAPPLQLSLASGGPGIQVANAVKVLSILIDHSSSPSTHCKDAREKLFAEAL